MVEVFIQGKRTGEFPACLHFCEVKLNSGELRSYGHLASLTAKSEAELFVPAEPGAKEGERTEETRPRDEIVWRLDL